MARAAAKRCKDCIAEGVTRRRKAPNPGPRCATHHRQVRAARSAARKATHVSTTYTLTDAEYRALLKAQDGVCYICHKKPGRHRRLSVDHEHGLCSDHPSDKGCGKCVRGLLHSKCNSFLGWIRDDPLAMERGAEYLRNPPARAVLSAMRGKS